MNKYTIKLKGIESKKGILEWAKILYVGQAFILAVIFYYDSLGKIDLSTLEYSIGLTIFNILILALLNYSLNTFNVNLKTIRIYDSKIEFITGRNFFGKIKLTSELINDLEYCEHKFDENIVINFDNHSSGKKYVIYKYDLEQNDYLELKKSTSK